jgi:serine/threonine-protein kinase
MERHRLDPALRHEIESIFEAALELPVADRARWLAERCGTDHRLRAEVDALIAAHERAEGALEANIGAAAAGALQDANRGRRIGAYRVLRELGRGGMGVVYLAERDDGQYQQRVAVKLLRASPDAEELRRRFLAERQILASLKHRGIAQLLDGGVTDGQLPFLVMEYVDGAPITTYCDRRKLGIDARLRLFRDVCFAVHYAHQNLVIHRDIKPGNILVTPDGGVKLLDFGIAKLLNPALGPHDQPLTRTELRAMTPEYASPEQIRGEVVTTASDVYALGVVLYELLSGRRPYYLTSRSPQELMEVVGARVPDRPSSAVTRPIPSAASNATSSPTAEEIAHARGVSVERLRHLLSGDLDAIVMMALRKEATDRYGSADLLWEDLQRYLDGLPVLAHRGSRLYRARKFFGRHRVESVAASLVALSLAVGAGVAFRQASVAARERDRAERARADAEQTLRQSEAVTGFLVGLFDATTATASAGPVTAQELLRRGIAQIARLDNQPLVQARMLEAIARVQMTMAQYPEARTALERSLALRVAGLGPNHAEVATTLVHLGELERRTGRYHEADSLTRRALAIRTATLGARDPAIADVLGQLAIIAVYQSDLHGAEEMSRRALVIRRESLGASDPLIGTSLELHASHLRRLGRDTEAEVELRQAIAIYQASSGPRSAEAAGLQLRLADLILETRGDTSQSESLMRSALATLRTSLGNDHPRTGWAMGDLAALLAARGKHAEALDLARTGLGIIQRAFGAEHPNSADMTGQLVLVYRQAGRFAEGERLERDAIKVFERTLGQNHSAYAGALGIWSEMLMELGRYDEAIVARRRAIEIRRQLFGDSGGLVGIDASGLARIYARKGDFVTADSLFTFALANLRRLLPETHHNVREVYGFMSERYRLEGKRVDAERYAQLAQPRVR